MVGITERWETHHAFDPNDDYMQHDSDSDDSSSDGEREGNYLNQENIWDETTNDSHEPTNVQDETTNDSHEPTNVQDEPTIVSHEATNVQDEPTIISHEATNVGRYYTNPGSKPVQDLSVEEVKAMTFSSENECVLFYKELAFCKGFGVRLDEQTRNKAGTVTSRSLCCSREGFRLAKYLESAPGPRGKSNESRCGCCARIKFNLNRKSQKWEVQCYDEDHNHPLIGPRKVYLHRSFREITEADRVEASTLKDLGLNCGAVMSVLAQQRGGYENVGFITKDMYNNNAAEQRELLRLGDVNQALNYLRAKQAIDESCTFRETTDNQGRLEHLFWVDSAALFDYRFFSDVVSFDATYKTNIYQRPLVLFVGTNNHRQTLLFGTALLANEEESSYIWLLRAFTECHNGRHPGSVITDSARAIRNAVSNVWPNTRHRLCSWHLQRNVQGQIQNDDFTAEYMRLMFKRCSPDEFEQFWWKLLADYGVPEDNGWATENYNKRHLWGRAYLSGVFFAGMTTTQRSEGVNSFVKKVVARNMRVHKLVEEFDKGLIRWRLKVLVADYKSKHTTPVLQTGLRIIEEHARNIYTYACFRKFVDVLKEEQQFFVKGKETIASSSVCICTVMMFGNLERHWRVEYDSEKNLIHCSCKLFEEAGLPCAHIIATMKSEQIQRIPSCCIMRRWTKDAMSGSELKKSVSKSGDGDNKTRFAALSSMSTRMFYEASQHSDTFSLCRDVIADLSVRINATRDKRGRAVSNNVSSDGSIPEAPVVNVGDPEFARARSTQSPGSKRSKTRTRQPKSCSVCRQPKHTITTCPVRIEQERIEKEAATQRTHESSDYSQPQSSYGIHYNNPQPPLSFQPGIDNSYCQPSNYQVPPHFNYGAPDVYPPHVQAPSYQQQQRHVNPAMGGLFGHVQVPIHLRSNQMRVDCNRDRQPDQSKDKGKNVRLKLDMEHS